MATLLEDVRCTVCRGHGVFMDVARDGAVVTVSARCYTCDHDYGVIGGASRHDVNDLDAVDDAARRVVRAQLW